ncbi:hypothetical protein ACKLNR_002576 [Fusarium oxysporum f. sp. zingiberi]
MGLFNDIDIERDFPDHKVKSMVRRSEWAVQQHQGFFPGNSPPNHRQYPTQEYNTIDSYSPTYYGTREVVCCGRSWKQGANYRKHYNRKHNRRLNCVFQNNCDYLGADKKELHRHYWVSHKEYARANKIPDPSGTCKACGEYFSRKDRIPRHLSRSLSCRVKLGLKK